MFWFGVAMLATTAYTTKRQIDESKKAQRFRELQAEEELKRANIMAVRGAREQIRQQRKEAARVLNAAALSGTQGSSGTSGAIAGSLSDLSSNQAFTNQMSSIDKAVGQYGLGAARANTAGTIWGAYGNLAQQAGSVFGGGT